MNIVFRLKFSFILIFCSDSPSFDPAQYGELVEPYGCPLSLRTRTSPVPTISIGLIIPPFLRIQNRRGQRGSTDYGLPANLFCQAVHWTCLTYVIFVGREARRYKLPIHLWHHHG
jgi:hypothetical protein